MPNMTVNNGTTFSDIYSNFKSSSLGRDDKHLRFSQGKGLYTHSKFSLSGWGRQALQGRQQKWNDAAQQVKQAVANEFGSQFANKAFDRLGIKNEITRSDLDRIQREVTRMKSTADKGFASENYQFLSGLTRLDKIDPAVDLVGYRQAFTDLVDKYIDPNMPGWQPNDTNKPMAELNLPDRTRKALLHARQNVGSMTTQDFISLRGPHGALGKAYQTADGLLYDNTQSRQQYWQHESADLDTIAENIDRLA